MYTSDKQYVEDLVSKYLTANNTTPDLETSEETSEHKHDSETIFCWKCGSSIQKHQNFCSKCGASQTQSEQITNQTRLTHTKKRKWSIKKKIGLGVVIFFGIMIVLGSIGSSYNSDIENNAVQITSSSFLSADSNIVTNSEFESLRPTRDDVGTAWQETQDITYDDMSYVYKRMHREGQNDMSNFTSRWSVGYVKGNGFDTSLLAIQIYRFETIEKAGNFYNQFLGYYKEMGGYEEWNTNAQSCYGSEVQGSMMDKVAMYCLKGNIVTFLSSAGMDKYDLEKRLSEIASNIQSKF